MARQKGLVRYSGTMGGVRHFKIKGLKGDFAGLVGGPEKEQVLKDPAFKRTRENMKEFSGSAKNAKVLRSALSSLVKTMGDPQLAGRLTKVFKAVNIEGSGPRGERPILLTQNWDLLEEFEFNRKLSFGSVFQAPYSITETQARDSSDLDVPAFNPSDKIDVPAGATHFRIINALAVVSDYQFDSNSNLYEPKEPTLDGLNDIEYSSYLPVDQPINSTTTVTATLPGSPTLTQDVSVVNGIGVEFYQQVNSTFYLFATGNVMKVGKLF